MRLGILGGGQLARMLALAAHPLGVRCTVLDPAGDACAGAVADHLPYAYDDPDGLDRLAAASDVVTFEFENVPAAAAARLESAVAVHPPPRSLEVSQDRLAEKRLFAELGIETPAHRPLDSQADVDALNLLPAVVKTRRLGYDGKGQERVGDRSDLAGLYDRLGAEPAIAEELVSFDRELSLIIVRDRAGEDVCYPLVENHHRDGILRLTRAPAVDVPAELQALGERYARAVAAHLGHVGVLALELFQVGDRLLANELAPRVHNSGHWTIEGAVTSQFENHVRAVLGLPLGSTEARGRCTMVNLIGHVPDRSAVLAVPGAHLHDYGKAARPGRKVGHVTLLHPAQEPRMLALVEELDPAASPG
jgi:5-(carboxyamino)imidazole ribonucleotide synthase